MSLFDRYSSSAHWLLRIACAGVFVYHGLTKWPVLGAMAQMMGLPVGMVLVVAVAETAGGLLILIGGVGYDKATRIGAAMLIPVMLADIAMVHWGQWSFVPSESHPMGGMEFPVTVLVLQTYFLIRGNQVGLEVSSAQLEAPEPARGAPSPTA